MAYQCFLATRYNRVPQVTCRAVLATFSLIMLEQRDQGASTGLVQIARSCGGGQQTKVRQSCVGHDPRESTANGYDTRIGLEDTLTLPGGQLAKDNAELVAHAVRKAQQIGAR